MTGTASPILEIKRLTKEFDGLKVIDDISLTLMRGRRIGLIGPNGAGKTMLFNLITGVYPPTAGSISIDSRDITAAPAVRRVHYGIARTFQNVRLLGHLTALENVLLGQHVRMSAWQMVIPVMAGSGNRWMEECRAGLEEAGLGAHAHTQVRNLPFGIRKRIEVVRAIMTRPQLLLLDEPAAGLNEAETDAFRDQLDDVSRRGITIFVIEHDMNFVSRFCEDLIAFNFGRKIAEGTPDQVRMNAEVRQAYLGL
ncbi:MAG: ABC transporter ATP-binding protein [Pseudorhodoplanes sp.]|uniref:ABC transporter ATP-binding protein n=1 Tax=Pseudorhodoplanes sp. TaxID=1934341 RepID=UPI003D0BA4C8